MKRLLLCLLALMCAAPASAQTGTPSVCNYTDASNNIRSCQGVSSPDGFLDREDQRVWDGFAYTLVLDCGCLR